MSAIRDTVNNTVHLGSAAYPDPLTIYGIVRRAAGAYSPGVIGAAPGVTLANSGSVYGGPGSATYRGSVAVRFANYGGTLVNNQTGVIQGGAGFASSTRSGLGSGGAGVEIDNTQTLSNAGTITGGSSYRATGAQYPISGGDGVLSGFSTIQNAGSTGHVATIAGGYGYGGAYGGDGVDLAGGAVTNGADGIISGGAARDQFGGVGADLSQKAAACYRRGTRIRTSAGDVPIESLRIGDHVMTESGVGRPIRWIGRRGYSRGYALGNPDVLPIRIRAGALGSVAAEVRVPLRDLWVSPEHAMWIDGMLIPARALVNGTTIVQETDCEVNYVHLELDSHDVIFAEGAPSESFIDDDSREHFDNAPEYARLYPQAAREPAQFCGPRVEAGTALEAIRRRLNAEAEIARKPANTPAPGSKAAPSRAVG